MTPYPKQILTVDELLKTYADAGMEISDCTVARDILLEIGYYRLRGYSFHLYNHDTKQYKPGTSLEYILSLYRFDSELRNLIFSMTGEIEVTLRTRFCEVLLQSGDPLIYLDAAAFQDKELFWKNNSTLSSEIARSRDPFIEHNYKNHAGQIPLWAAVEVMSFGSLSKFIKTLPCGSGSTMQQLASYYTYTTQKGKRAIPKSDMLTSWIHTTVLLRNMCVHNSRIYNRSLSLKPVLLHADQQTPIPKYCGLYHFMMAMKYLRQSDASWIVFMEKFQSLLVKYEKDIDLSRLHFPNDWEEHMNM